VSKERWYEDSYVSDALNHRLKQDPDASVEEIVKGVVEDTPSYRWPAVQLQLLQQEVVRRRLKLRNNRANIAEAFAQADREGRPLMPRARDLIKKNLETFGSPFPPLVEPRPRPPEETPANVVPMRRAGRPRSTQRKFWDRYREAVRDIGRIPRDDQEIADHLLVRSKGQLSRGISVRQLQRLIKEHQRPPDRNTE
jgi:hypothetical protein